MAWGLCRQVLSYRQDFQVPQACAVLPKLAMGAPTPHTGLVTWEHHTRNSCCFDVAL